MALEDLTGAAVISALVRTNPESGDSLTQGDDHIRGLKNVILNTWPNVNGPVTLTDEQINALLTRLDYIEAAPAWHANRGTSAQSINSGNATNLIFNNVVREVNSSGFNVVDGGYTVQRSGWYSFRAGARLTGGVTRCILNLTASGAVLATTDIFTDTGSQIQGQAISAIAYVTVGAVLRANVLVTGIGPFTMLDDPASAFSGVWLRD
jgi:hypothetical protein